jgi:flagellar biosynthesis protein FlhF
MSVQVSPSRTQASAGRATAAPFAAAAYSAAAGRSQPSDVAAVRAELKGDIRLLRARVADSEDTSSLAAEIAALRELVEDLGNRAPAAKGNKAAAWLKTVGVEGPAATALARALKGKSPDAETMQDALSRIVKTAEWPLSEERTVVALIGPSGVGKTTTAAKLAGRARMAGKTVSFVGCDSFRIGAREQLGRYAQLLGAEVSWARQPEQLASLVAESRSDVVIVDTSGRAPTPDGVENGLTVAQLAPSDRARHVLLCIPAAIRAADATRVGRLYGVLAPTALASTKLDETETPAGIVHAAWASRLPYAVLCFGQRVPEDVSPATVRALAEYLVPRGGGKAAA